MIIPLSKEMEVHCIINRITASNYIVHLHLKNHPKASNFI